MIHPYPLQWPEGQPRSRTRVKSAFRAELPAAIKNVQTSIRLFAQDTGMTATAIVVTSNADLMGGTPKDTGVSVWFEWDGQQRCIAVDRYETIKANLQAIHHVLEARRTEMRHAGIEVVRSAFRGFIALPPPSSSPALTKATWWQVLGVAQDASPDAIQAAYKAKARIAKTDDERKALNIARDEGVSL